MLDAVNYHLEAMGIRITTGTISFDGLLRCGVLLIS